MIWFRYAALVGLVVCCLTPLWSLYFGANVDPETWAHLRQYLLPQAVLNTLLLGLGVAAMGTLLGGGLAAVNTFFDYPGRRFFRPLMILPLAMPGYLLAFVWLGVTVPKGINTSQVGWAIAVLSLTLYPYVYLTALAAFKRIDAKLIDSARLLAARPWRVMVTILLPLLLPALTAGVLLMTLEALADFGAVAMLNVDTITTTIYRVWFNLFDLPSAARLAGLYLLPILILIAVLEWLQSRRPRTNVRPQPIRAQKVSWPIATAVILTQSLVLTLSFVWPVVQLFGWSLRADWAPLSAPFVVTLILAAGGAGLIAIVALLAVRLARGLRASEWLLRLASLGYAVPGTVLAVASILFVRAQFGEAAVVGFLSAGVIALLLAYAVRFLRLGLTPLQAAERQFDRQLTESAKLLGAPWWRRWWQIEARHLAPILVACLAFCFIEIAKELPATLMLRPFGWDTLAVKIFQYTTEGDYMRAAPAALLLSLIGLLPAWLIARRL